MNIFKRIRAQIHSITSGHRLRKQQEELHRQQLRNLRLKLEENIRLNQAQCPHLQGSNPLSEESSELTSIVWHYFNDLTWRGICTTCQRKFVPSDKDFYF